MKIHNNHNITNFKGFTNVIGADFSSKFSEFYNIALQLNNDGTNDLDKFKSIKKELKMSSPDDDLIYINYIKNKDSDFDAFVVNDVNVPTADLILDGACSKEEEAKFIKLYTLVASLTKRISNQNLLDWNRQVDRVARHSYKILQRFFKNEEMTVDAMTIMCGREVPPQKIAGKINRGIHNNMKKVFR